MGQEFYKLTKENYMEKLNWIKDKVMSMPKHKQIALAICVVAVIAVILK